MNPPPPPREFTISALALRTGCDRYAIMRWLLPLTPRIDGKRKLYDEVKAMELIKPHMGKKRTNVQDGEMSGFARLNLAKAIAQERENEEAEREKSEKWMLTADHQELVRQLMNQLEQLPGKAQSELGLTAVQVTGIRRMIDAVRNNVADGVEDEK